MEKLEETLDALTVEISDGVARARLEGELSINTVDTLKDSLFSLLNAQEIQIDLSNVTEIDSCGLQMLVILHQQTALLNRQFALTETHPQLDQLLAVYQLTLPQAALTEIAP